MARASERQADYYARTATAYDVAHGEGHHNVALRYVDGVLRTLGATSLLDVGSGTGRAIRYFREHRPDVDVRGVEPVEALIAEGEALGIPHGIVLPGDGARLPFADSSFDAVTEFGVLHHVERPDVVVREMTRVARRAIFLSDGNRFGQGALPARLLKLALFETGLWPTFNWVRTRGRGHMESPDDGIFWSYSVYDSLGALAEWASHIFAVPLSTQPSSSRLVRYAGPLLTAPVVLLCAVRD